MIFALVDYRIRILISLVGTVIVVFALTGSPLYGQTPTGNGTLTRISRAHYPISYSTFTTYYPNNTVSTLSRDGLYIAVPTPPEAFGYGRDTFPLFIQNHARHTNKPIAATPNGAPLPDNVNIPSLSFSDDGRYLAIETDAVLSTIDTGGYFKNIYLYDQTLEHLTLVSKGMNNTRATGDSSAVRVSADGHYLVFASTASNLVPNDTNGKSDIFRYTISTDTLERISMGVDGAESNDSSMTPVVSADGSVIAFTSNATNLIEQDSYGLCYSMREDGNCPDIFVWDETAPVFIERVSVATNGDPANFKSYAPEITADGLQVFFLSDAFNLDPNDGNNTNECGDSPSSRDCNDIYLHDRETHTTRIVSHNMDTGYPGGGWVNFRISDNGAQVVATTYSNVIPGLNDGYNCDREGCHHTIDTVRIDIALHQMTALTPAPSGMSTFGNTTIQDISADGHWLVFGSTAGDWFPGDISVIYEEPDFSFGDYDFGLLYIPTSLFLRLTGISVSDGNGNATTPHYLPEDEKLIFTSDATTIAVPQTGAYFYDKRAQITTPLSLTNSPYTIFSDIGSYYFTPDGRFMVATSTTAGYGRLVWYDQIFETMAPYIPYNLHYPSVTPDAKRIIFASNDNSLTPKDTNQADDVFIFDIATQQYRQISAAAPTSTGNGESTQPTLQPDGTAVVYVSRATNIISDTNGTVADLYRYDARTGDTTFLVTGIAGEPTNGDSIEPVYALGGGYIAFTSEASNLVLSDTNGVSDVFVVNTTSNEIERVSLSSDGTEGNGASSHPVVSRDGRFIAFVSEADNLIENDADGPTANVFMHNRETGETITLSYLPDGTSLDPDLTTFDISDDGERFLFQTERALVDGDELGYQDIYEWNRTGEEESPYQMYLPAITQ